MSGIADRYRRLSADLTATVVAVPEDRWDAPTPCEGWTVRELVEHVTSTQPLILGSIGMTPDPSRTSPR